MDFNGREPLTPDRVTQADAAQLLETARLSVGHAHAALGRLSVDVVAAAHALAPEMAAFFDRLFDGKRPEQVLAYLRQLLVVAPEMSADELMELLMSKTATPDG